MLFLIPPNFDLGSLKDLRFLVKGSLKISLKKINLKINDIKVGICGRAEIRDLFYPVEPILAISHLNLILIGSN